MKRNRILMSDEIIGGGGGGGGRSCTGIKPDQLAMITSHHQAEKDSRLWNKLDFRNITFHSNFIVKL